MVLIVWSRLELVKNSNVYAAEDTPKPTTTPATTTTKSDDTNVNNSDATNNINNESPQTTASVVVVVVEVPTDVARCLFPLALAHYRLGDTNATEKWLTRAENVLKHAASFADNNVSSSSSSSSASILPQTPTKQQTATSTSTPTKSTFDRRTSAIGGGVGGGGGKRIAALSAASVVPADAVRTLRLVVCDSRDASMKLSIIVGVTLVTAGLYTAWRYR